LSGGKQNPELAERQCYQSNYHLKSYKPLNKYNRFHNYTEGLQNYKDSYLFTIGLVDSEEFIDVLKSIKIAINENNVPTTDVAEIRNLAK
jgi:hypothetical protein